MAETTRALFVTDLDGTLLGPDREIAAANLDAIARASAAGVQVAVVTGRRLSSLLPEYRKLDGLRYRVATSNGAVVLWPDNRWAEKVHGLDWRLANELMARPDLGHATFLFATAPATAAGLDDGEPDCYVVPAAEPPADERAWMKSWRAYLPETFEPADRAQAMGKTLVHLVMRLETRAEADRVARRLAPALADRASIHVVTSPVGPGALTEVVPRGGKGLALRYLQASLGVDAAHTAAVGDEMNDADLLDAAAHRYAVGGSLLARRRADATEVEGAAAGAVADAIDRFLAAL